MARAVGCRRPLTTVVVLHGAGGHPVFVLERDSLAVVAEVAHPRTEDSDRRRDAVCGARCGFVRTREDDPLERLEEARLWVGGIKPGKLVSGAASQPPLREVKRRRGVVIQLDVFGLV